MFGSFTIHPFSLSLGSGRIPDTQVNVHMKHGTRAKNYGEVGFMDSATSWCTFSQHLNLISEREREGVGWLTFVVVLREFGLLTSKYSNTSKICT